MDGGIERFCTTFQPDYIETLVYATDPSKVYTLQRKDVLSFYIPPWQYIERIYELSTSYYELISIPSYSIRHTINTGLFIKKHKHLNTVFVKDKPLNYKTFIF